eukprot:5945326-Amphidinium_carterae.1
MLDLWWKTVSLHALAFLFLAGHPAARSAVDPKLVQHGREDATLGTTMRWNGIVHWWISINKRLHAQQLKFFHPHTHTRTHAHAHTHAQASTHAHTIRHRACDKNHQAQMP